MFEALSVLKPAPVLLSPEQMAVMMVHHKAIETSLRNGEARSRLLSTTTSLNRVAKDFADLRRLKKIVKTEGLNRSLLSFVNPVRGGLSRIIPGLPAIETMDMVPVDASDPRAQDAISGIDQVLDTEPEVIADHIRTGADTVDTILCVVQDQTKEYGPLVSHYLLSLEDCSDTAVTEGLSDSTLNAIPYEHACACVEALLDVLPEIDAVIVCPTESDAVEAHLEKMTKLVDRVGSYVGIAVDPEDPHQLCLCERAPQSMPVEDRLESHGYTVENTIGLLKTSDNLLDALNGLIGRKDEICSQFVDAAVMIASIDNDVPPSVDNAIAPEPEEPAQEGGDLTQADIIQSHASSHMCCISAVTEAAVAAVQNVLSVADHIYQFCQKPLS